MHTTPTLVSLALLASLAPKPANGTTPSKDQPNYKEIYGPLNSVRVPVDVSYTPYPLTTNCSKEVTHGGLDPICFNCNSTGCFCPSQKDVATVNDQHPCKSCTAEMDGLHCYCSVSMQVPGCGEVGMSAACNMALEAETLGGNDTIKKGGSGGRGGGGRSGGYSSLAGSKGRGGAFSNVIVAGAVGMAVFVDT